MRVCVKEKLRIGGGTIQLSVTQSIVQPVWSDAPARSLTRRTEHHNKSAVTAETTNHLKRGLSSRCWIQLAYHSFRFLDKKFEWLRKNNNNKQFFFHLTPVCQNEGQSESLSQPQSEFAILPLCQPVARLFWRDRWKRSPLYGKKGKYIKRGASTSSCSGEWEQSSDIPASCKSLANKIASKVWKDDGAPLLFPPKHVRQWLWCWTNLTQGASSGVGAILEQTFRIHFVRIMSITVIVFTFLFQEMLRHLHDGFSRQPYKGFIALLLVCWESAPHGPGPSQPVTPAWSERMPFLNCQRWTGGQNSSWRQKSEQLPKSRETTSA